MAENLEFDGAIQLIDWYRIPESGDNVQTLIGRVRIIPDTELGFKIRTNGQANYLVAVKGPTGHEVIFPGCKVHAFVRHADEGDKREVHSNTAYLVP